MCAPVGEAEVASARNISYIDLTRLHDSDDDFEVQITRVVSRPQRKRRLRRPQQHPWYRTRSEAAAEAVAARRDVTCGTGHGSNLQTTGCSGHNNNTSSAPVKHKHNI